MPARNVLDTLDNFIAKAKNATDDETRAAVINDAIREGATVEHLLNGIASTGIIGQDLRADLGKESAQVPSTPETKNLFRVFMLLRERRCKK
jgi:hypothetical protein